MTTRIASLAPRSQQQTLKYNWKKKTPSVLSICEELCSPHPLRRLKYSQPTGVAFLARIGHASKPQLAAVRHLCHSPALQPLNLKPAGSFHTYGKLKVSLKPPPLLHDQEKYQV